MVTRDETRLLDMVQKQKIVTRDGTLCFRYDLETKQASSQWKHSDSTRPKKAHQVGTNVKTMLVLFYLNGIFFIRDLLNQGRQ